MEAEALQQLKNELQAIFGSKLEGLQAEIATLREQNEELLAQTEKKSQSEEVQLQAQQASMRMQLIQQARLETEKFSVAVRCRKWQRKYPLRKGNSRCQ
jgi:hypothetical protein